MSLHMKDSERYISYCAAGDRSQKSLSSSGVLAVKFEL